MKKNKKPGVRSANGPRFTKKRAALCVCHLYGPNFCDTCYPRGYTK